MAGGLGEILRNRFILRLQTDRGFRLDTGKKFFPVRVMKQEQHSQRGHDVPFLEVFPWRVPFPMDLSHGRGIGNGGSLKAPSSSVRPPTIL